MENKGCLLFIAFFAAIIAIANCDDKKSSSTINSSSYSNSSSRYSSSNGSTYHATETKPREKTEAERLLEVYEGNSLSNGSQPYSSVYGTNSTFRGYIITTFVR